jgi:hypothetical protein
MHHLWSVSTIAALMIVVLTACAPPPTVRPSGVPLEAVRVPFSKRGGWAHCWLDPAANVNRCRTYNADGQRIYRPGRETDDDDVFLPYDGSGPVAMSSIDIDADNTQPDVVWLKSGQVLIPRNDVVNQKKLVDAMMDVRRRKAEQ